MARSSPVYARAIPAAISTWLSESGWDKVLDVNVEGVFLRTQALLPMLTVASSEGDPSRVINTGSVDGIVAPSIEFDNFSHSASS